MDKLTALTPAMLLALFLAASPASAKCWSWQTDCSDGGGSKWQKPKPSTSWAITNKRRQRLGDIYNPGIGRLQIRNNHWQIIGYIERDGTVTNTIRQPVADIELD